MYRKPRPPHESSHIQYFSSQLSFSPFACLFLLKTLGGDSGVTHQSRCLLRLLSAVRIFVLESMPLFNKCPTLYCHRSTGIKSHFSAAEAVILCCQSPLCCRSCICSSLVLSIDGVGAAGASTGTIMQFHKPAKLRFPTHGSAFFLKREVRKG